MRTYIRFLLIFFSIFTIGECNSTILYSSTCIVSPPSVTGNSPTHDPTPTWHWTSSGGGNGNYRCRLDSESWTKTRMRSFTPPMGLPEGRHTLYVQESDAAGNWSISGRKSIIIDLTPPLPPSVTGNSPTHDPTPTWHWTSSGGGNGNYRCRLDSESWTKTRMRSFTPPMGLPEGRHTLYVQESDAAGNWSTSGRKSIIIDIPNISWNIVDLGVLAGDDYSEAYDINDNGEVVGVSGVAPQSQTGFYWDSGTLEPVLGFGGDPAESINNQGVIVGIYLFLGGNNGYIRQKNGDFIFLMPPQNWSQSALYSINNKGHAAGTGYSNFPPSGYRGFFFDGTDILPIEPLPGDSETWAIAVNDSDIVTGYSTSNPNQAVGRGYIFNSGSITEIGFLPGASNSYPQAINNHGVVVGISGGQAFSYTNGVIQALGFLPGDSYSVANGINDTGDIVGRSGERAFLFRNGMMIDLSALPVVQQEGWSSLYEARSINNNSQIVGQGYRNGFYHAFLLSPATLGQEGEAQGN